MKCAGERKGSLSLNTIKLLFHRNQIFKDHTNIVIFVSYCLTSPS